MSYKFRHYSSIFSILLLSVILSFYPSILFGEIFVWIDSKGIKHYSNVLPSQSVKDIQTYIEKGSSEEKYVDRESEFQNTNENGDDETIGPSDMTGPKHDGSVNNIKFKVIKIYDGDSMKVKGAGMDFMVRLVGIDAPESGKRNQKNKKSNKNLQNLFGKEKGSGQPFSSESKEALTRIVGKKDIYIKSYGTDRYNRILGEIFTSDGTLVNLEMVKLGMAEVYRGLPPKELNIKSYRNAESEAKRASRGIWYLGSNYQSPKEWRKND
ncbi:MAG: thermonuclease family protein [Desulfamplus sp.]|nr:thermonuclease family protein [Desulfamplus sp.]